MPQCIPEVSRPQLAITKASTGRSCVLDHIATVFVQIGLTTVCERERMWFRTSKSMDNDVKTQFNSTLGAMFLGQFATAVNELVVGRLYGITSLQAFFYYKQHPRDPPLIRWLVCGLWCLDSLHMALIEYAAYYYMVLNFADPFDIVKPIWSVMVMIIVSNLQPPAMEMEWKGHHLALDHSRTGRIVLVDHRRRWSLYVGFGLEVVVDGIITVSQCLVLRRFRTGIRSTDSIISVLMVYSINTGMLTSLCAIVCLITYTVLPNMFVYFVFYFVLSKLYVNCLLANLNARTTILEAGHRPLGKFDVSEATTTGESHFGSTAPQASCTGVPFRFRFH
ncbi:predicted protein [Postia placenta Mad-698-R]|nr:predicted protein [Postia placenta Mad-698-R]